MADKKISELTALTGANVATDDQLVIVDTSAALTKNITIDEFKNALDTATGFVRITGDTMTGDLSMGDNVKAIFGAGSDLWIYSDGTDSYIEERNGTGSLYIDATDLQLRSTANAKYFRGITGGAVDLYYDNASKFATSSTGISVTGTVTADGLTVAKGSVGQVASFSGDDVSGARALQVIASTTTNTGDTHSINAQSSTGIVKLSTNNNTQRLAVFPSGDISFYEDTGTTAKFFWDASAESLGIGTSSPSYPLHISTANLTQARFESIGTSGSYVQWRDADTTSGQAAWIGSDGDLFKFYSNNNTLNMTMTTAGNVGIGTSSPDEKLEVYQGNIKLGTDTNTTSKLIFERSAANRAEIYVGSSNQLQFDLGGSERMRIDSSGNLLVGDTSQSGTANRAAIFSANKFGLSVIDTTSFATNVGGALNLGGNYRTTGDAQAFCRVEALKENATDGNFAYAMAFSTTPNGGTFTEAMRIDSSGNLLVGTTELTLYDETSGGETGFALRPDGRLYNSTQASTSAIFNRLGTDGDILQFRKDGATVGSIGASGGSAYVGGYQNAGIYFNGTTDIRPWNTSTRANLDNSIDLGSSSARFKDLYLSGGVFAGATSGGAKVVAEAIATGTTYSASWPATGGTALYMQVNSSAVGSITTTTSATAYNTSSDYRLKTDAQPMTGATDRLKQLNPVNFEWIADGTRVDGFLAHEAQAVVPEAVTGAKDAMRDEEYEVTPAVTDDDGNVVTEAVMGTRSVPDYQGIDQSKLVPLLVATIQELEARITALENG